MTPYRHLMLDLETLGTRPGCVIRSIGAVYFDFDGRPLGPTYYANIDTDSCLAVGLTIDPRVEAWWGEQSPEARAALDYDKVPIRDALDGFSLFVEDNGETDLLSLWSHGASFDIPITEAAMVRTGSPMPWKFQNNRDTRTMIWLAEQLGHTVEPSAPALRHHALDDAKARAFQMMQLRRRFGP